MAQQQPIKIFELSGNSWLKGISVHPYIPIGGLFKDATNFDPFNRIGIFRPSVAESRRGATTITTAGIEFTVGFSESSHGYFYGFGDDGANAKVYQVGTLNAEDNVTNKTSSVKAGLGIMGGAARFKNRVVYAGNTTVRSNQFGTNFSTANEVGILSLTTGGYVHEMQVAPDRNLYITNKNCVAKVTSVSDKSQNVAQFLTFEEDVVLRDLDSDGQNLVIAGDTNINSEVVNVQSRCFVGYWNMKSQDLTTVWDFNDVQIFAIKQCGDETVVFGRNNIYSCSVGSPPRILIPLRPNSNFASAYPVSPSAVASIDKEIIVWGDQQSTVYGYGRPHPSLDKIFFKRNSTTSTTIGALYFDGFDLWGGTTDVKLWVWATSIGTLTSSVLQVSDIDFKQPYRFAYAKVVLEDVLDTGESVSLQISTADGDRLVLNSSTFSFTADGAVATHLFYPNFVDGSSGTAPLFEDMTSIQISNTQTNIRRLELWGYPERSDQQTT